MAQIKLLKIHTNGLPIEFDSASDEITLASFTVQGGGPVLGATGLDMNGQDVSDLSDLVFTDPSVGTINQTAGSVIVDNLMAKERANAITSAGDIQFGVIADAAGEVDSLVLPKLAGAPTAVPTAGEGSFLYDTTNDKLWLYTTAGWDDLSTVTSAKYVSNIYTAEEALAAVDAVYISSADSVSKADADVDAKASVIGFAKAAALITTDVEVVSEGVLTGFSGLTAGSRYFLSATPGLITDTAPTGAGNNIVSVGFAKSATALQIQIQYIGKKVA